MLKLGILLSIPTPHSAIGHYKLMRSLSLTERRYLVHVKSCKKGCVRRHLKLISTLELFGVCIELKLNFTLKVWMGFFKFKVKYVYNETV